MDELVKSQKTPFPAIFAELESRFINGLQDFWDMVFTGVTIFYMLINLGKEKN